MLYTRGEQKVTSGRSADLPDIRYTKIEVRKRRGFSRQPLRAVAQAAVRSSPALPGECTSHWSDLQHADAGPRIRQGFCDRSSLHDICPRCEDPYWIPATYDKNERDFEQHPYARMGELVFMSLLNIAYPQVVSAGPLSPTQTPIKYCTGTDYFLSATDVLCIAIISVEFRSVCHSQTAFMSDYKDQRAASRASAATISPFKSTHSGTRDSTKPFTIIHSPHANIDHTHGHVSPCTPGSRAFNLG